MALSDILKDITGAAGDFFSSKAQAEAAAAQANGASNLALLNLQGQQQQAALTAQTQQRSVMYIALAVVGLVAFTMLARKT